VANPYYQPGQQRAARVSDLFSRIAPRYDLINDLQCFGLHRWWKRRVARLADPRPGERALDVCCGTGDLAFALARRGADVVGLDFCAPMLAIAQQRWEARRAKLKIHTAVEFAHGDAQQLPFPDGGFDIVTIGYGLRNLADWRAGLREMGRVARPGGRLLVLDFGKPDNAWWRRLYFAYLRWMVPVYGRVFCGDAQAYGYILESLTQYPAQHGVAAAMRELNCADVRVLNLLGGAMSINFGRKQAVPQPDRPSHQSLA
jgi:demethylmenaquinone methyltransferase/2-methoxy-6-polyprenyl-1,4-benzoquinol methylase